MYLLQSVLSAAIKPHFSFDERAELLIKKAIS